MITGEAIPPYKHIVIMAKSLEHTTGISMSGYQDQIASLFGGVNFIKWYHPVALWADNKKGRWFERESLLDDERIKYLNELMATYYSGASHSSVEINTLQTRSMIDGTNRELWYSESEIAYEARDALKDENYENLVGLLNETCDARRKLLPPWYVNEFQSRVIEIASRYRGAARVAGAGAGGGIITLASTPETADRIRDECMILARKTPSAKPLDVKIDNKPASVVARKIKS